MFYRLYHIEQLSTNDIAERYKTSNENVRNQLIWFEIARRSEDAGNLKFKHGKHTTWDGKDVYFRSSYELRYAKELDNIKINYFLEGLIFYYIDSNSKYRRIIPDFYLPDTNEIVEIKSWFTYTKDDMSRRFSIYKSHGFECKLLLNDQEYFLENLPETKYQHSLA
jgi:hypothetical protein